MVCRVFSTLLTQLAQCIPWIVMVVVLFMVGLVYLEFVCPLVIRIYLVEKYKNTQDIFSVRGWLTVNGLGIGVLLMALSKRFHC